MRKAPLLPVIALAAFGLAGCGKKAPNEALEANESIGGDSNTMGEAVSDQDAAVNEAFANQTEAYDAVPEGNAAAAPAGGSGDEGSGDE